MATEAQTSANRSNAQKSTGPRTPEGKETAAQNALKHGLFARETVIRGEDEVEFEVHREMLLEQLIGDTPLEEMLAERIVDLSWRLKRAVQDQEKAFVALYERQTAGAGESGNAAGERRSPDRHKEEGQSGDWRSQANPEIGGPERAGTIGRMILEDFSGEAVLDRLLRYERRIESSLYRTLNQLRRVHDQVQKAALEDTSILERWREEDWEARKARAFARCRPPNVSGGPAGPTTNTPRADEDKRFKCEVSSLKLEEPASSPGSLPTSDFTLQTSGTTPAAPSETCETKPISAGVSSVKCQVLSEMRKTKPICGGGSDRQGGYTPIFRRRR